MFGTWQEIEDLSMLEETSLSSDLSQGFALKSLTGSESDIYFLVCNKLHFDDYISDMVFLNCLSCIFVIF